MVGLAYAEGWCASPAKLRFSAAMREFAGKFCRTRPIGAQLVSPTGLPKNTPQVRDSHGIGRCHGQLAHRRTLRGNAEIIPFPFAFSVAILLRRNGRTIRMPPPIDDAFADETTDRGSRTSIAGMRM
jgi:hypothetical protein